MVLVVVYEYIFIDLECWLVMNYIILCIDWNGDLIEYDAQWIKLVAIYNYSPYKFIYSYYSF